MSDGDSPAPPASKAPTPPSLSGAAIKATGWTFLIRWIVRLIGLGSLAVTARLLSPDDFGLAASATMVIVLFDTMSTTGIQAYIVKSADLTATRLRSAWTANAIMKTLVAAAVFLSAGVAASAMGDPRIADVLRILAAVPLIQAFASPVEPMMVRSFRFDRVFILRTTEKLVQSAVAVTLAMALGNYWAIVLAALAANATVFCVSYVLFRFRPVPSFEHIRELGIFSGWMMLRSVSMYLFRQSHLFIVRSHVPTAAFGIYNLGQELSRTFVSETVDPIAAAALPSTSRLRAERERLAAALTVAEGLIFYVALSVTAGLMLVADELVSVLLGSQWMQTAHYLPLIAPGIAAIAISTIQSTITVGLDDVRNTSLLWVAKAAVGWAAVMAAYRYAGPDGAALAFSATSVLSLVPEFLLLNRVLGRPLPYFRLLLRPAAAAAVMAAGLVLLPWPEVLPAIALLPAKCLVGAALFSATALALWKCGRQTEGPEMFLWDNATGVLRKFGRRFARGPKSS